MPLPAEDREGLTRISAFLQGLQELGWAVGRNVRIEYRWGATGSERVRKYAAELIALAPDVILAQGSSTVSALLRATRDVPIVFPLATDPVGEGLVDSLSRPGGNITGFLLQEYDTSGKWVELLKEIAPDVSRVAVLRDPALPSGIGQFAAVQAAGASLGVEVSPIDVGDPQDIEQAVTAFARSPNGGLIVTSGALTLRHRERIVALAERFKLPAVYGVRAHVDGGGLISYSPDLVDQFRRAAGYVDRILRGEKPSDLPVQAPIRYELVINLKAAKTLGVTVSPMLLARADEVIE